MIDTKTTSDKRNENEIVLIISDSVGGNYFKQLEKTLLFIGSILVLVWLIAFYATHVISTNTQATNLKSSANDAITSDMNSVYNINSIKAISRSAWNAEPPVHELDKLELPNHFVIIAHTATVNCSTEASCAFRVKMMQMFHIESRGWDDIGYNFLVGGDGAIYIGRGWDNQGAHTKSHNKKSICIAFIGTFNKITPPECQLIAAQKLLEEGVKRNKLIPDYKLYGQRQLIPSESPGLALYEIIKKWDHWTESG